MTVTPDTIVLIHGFWVTPRSWEEWAAHYEQRGFTVLTPSYPGLEVEVEALNADPSPIEALTVPRIIEHLEDVIKSVATPPILMGHSAGGAFMQIVMDHGFGAAGVALNSAPTEGVRATPLSQVKSTFPVLKNPANRHRAVGFTPEQFHYAFTNTLDAEASQAAYDRYAIAAPGKWVWDYGLIANFKPGHQETWVDYSADRAPLLFIAGAEDHIMPPSVNKSNYKHYKKSPALTEYVELEGRDHWTCAAPGWEAVADQALDWAVEHAQPLRSTAG
jgi:pimeloyl-ACP methyl ester carboxylesterase